MIMYMDGKELKYRESFLDWWSFLTMLKSRQSIGNINFCSSTTIKIPANARIMISLVREYKTRHLLPNALKIWAHIPYDMLHTWSVYLTNEDGS